MLPLSLWLAAVMCADLFVQPAAAGARPPGAPELWCDPLDDVYRGFLKRSVSPDYMQLFQPESPWKTVLAALQVFAMSAVVPLDKSLEDRRQIFGFLGEHHVTLALQTQGLARPQGCGRGQEAYRPLDEFMTALRRIKEAGGELRYISLDEPLWFAHSDAGKEGCKIPIPELAQEVAARLVAARAVFPDVVFGDIEPVNVFRPVELRATLVAWFDAYRVAAGEPFAYFQADLDWNRPYGAAVREAAGVARSRGMPFGVIYTGNYKVKDDLEWTRQALSRAREMMALSPDQSVFESWMVHPQNVLPEDDPASFTGLIVSYLAGRPR